MANMLPARRTPAASFNAAMARRPSPRSTGIMPSAGSSRRVVQLSRYSTLPTKLSVRRTVMINTTESKNETWFAARIAGPRRGSRSPPSTRTRHSVRYSGVAISLAIAYPGPNRPIGNGLTDAAPLPDVDSLRNRRSRPIPSADGHQSDRLIGTPAAAGDVHLLVRRDVGSGVEPAAGAGGDGARMARLM